MDYTTLRKKTGHGLIRSIHQEISYIHSVIAEPVTVRYKNIDRLLNPPQSIHISKTIYERYYSCLDYPGCSLCCTGFQSLFLMDACSYDTINTIEEQACGIIGQEVIRYNERPFLYWAVKHSNPLSDCQLLDKGCTVYKECPITCMFPLIKFTLRNSNMRVNISKSPFARPQYMPCPVEWKEYDSFQHFKDDTIWKFEHLKIYMDTLRLPHHVDRIIEALLMKSWGEVILEDWI